MKKKIRVLCLAIVLAALLCLYTFRVVQLNRAWPAPVRETYAIGETVPGPFNTEVVVHSARWMTDEEAEKYNANTNAWEHIGIVVDVSVTNMGDESIFDDRTSWMPMGGFWTNGMNMDAYMEMNPDRERVTGDVRIDPGETVRALYAYDLNDVQFPADRWATAAERPYQLVIASYPVLRVVELFPENLPQNS